MEQLLVSLLLSAVGALVVTLCSLKMLQIYQLSSYQAGGFFRWLKRTGGDYPIRYFSLGFFQFVSLLIFNFSFPDSYLKYIGLVLYLGLGIYFIVLQAKQKQKTPLKITKRMGRQLASLAVLNFSLCFLSVYFVYPFAAGYALLALVTVLIPIAVTLSHYIMLPMESAINNGYKRKAKIKLEKGIIKIAITGSYGKTTAKNILYALLSQKYKVLASPASHNTPMGICKLINAGIDGYDVFIAEMGARHKGDIAELCDFIRPDYGIITITGPQHLETFGSIDEIVRTKLELAEGTAKQIIINSDDEKLMTASVEIASGKKDFFLYSGTAGSDANYGNVRVSEEGTSFTLNIHGEKTDITTPLLGRHIPSLFAQCALLSHLMGVSTEQIKQAAEALMPVEHRLQLIKTDECTIIDDAYNSNPEGAKNALELLALFDGPKVVITPGFVEMGRLQQEENINLGKLAAECADYLLCINNNDISSGALAAGMDKSCIFEEDSLKKAMESLAALNLAHPVILFLNDLPDNY